MSRSIDQSKANFWTQLVRRFPQSGLSVAKFCSRHSVAPHAFYYWAKRLKLEQGAVSPPSAPQPSAIDSPQDAMVLIRFDDRLQVSIPADRTDILYQLVHEFGRLNESRQTVSGTLQPREFKQVVLRSQARSRQTH